MIEGCIHGFFGFCSFLTFQLRQPHVNKANHEPIPEAHRKSLSPSNCQYSTNIVPIQPLIWPWIPFKGSLKGNQGLSELSPILGTAAGQVEFKVAASVLLLFDEPTQRSGIL